MFIDKTKASLQSERETTMKYKLNYTKNLFNKRSDYYNQKNLEKLRVITKTHRRTIITAKSFRDATKKALNLFFCKDKKIKDCKTHRGEKTIFCIEQNRLCQCKCDIILK